MYSALVTMIFSLLIFMGVENSLAWGKVWLKPDGSTPGRVYCNFSRQMKIVADDTLREGVQPYFTMEKWEESDSPAPPPAGLRIRQFNTDPDSDRIEGDSIADGYSPQAMCHRPPSDTRWRTVTPRRDRPTLMGVAWDKLCPDSPGSLSGDDTRPEVPNRDICLDTF